jgi:hypothetical protein
MDLMYYCGDVIDPLGGYLLGNYDLYKYVYADKQSERTESNQSLWSCVKQVKLNVCVV